MKYSKLIAILAAGAVVCGTLTSCGGANTNQEQSQSAAESQPTADSQDSITAQLDDNALNRLTTGYANYVESFTTEFGGFVNDGDMDIILNDIGTLTEDNFDEWKGVYDNYHERCEHWYNELSAAEMLCPEDQKEAHGDLLVVVGTIYQVIDGMDSLVEDADEGDLSSLTSMASNYREADTILHNMWDEVAGDSE